MNTQENSTGKPLADEEWLENHHLAKLNERTAFAERISKYPAKKIVDLGCATGLWLDLLNDFFPSECEFIGIDSDPKSLSIALEKSKSWKRKSSFLNLDLEKDVAQIPIADITLAFNIFPYIKDLNKFINIMHSKNPTGILAIRQYDGASIRFGPMATSNRQKFESDLRIATENSKKFSHYDMDRTFNAINKSNYSSKNIGFELFERKSPFPKEFIPYYNGTLEWTIQHVSDSSAEYLEKWIKDDILLNNRYFFEVDLVAILS